MRRTATRNPTIGTVNSRRPDTDRKYVGAWQHGGGRAAGGPLRRLDGQQLLHLSRHVRKQSRYRT
eukprot:3332683-Rhodomonas_salina.6